MDLFDNIKTEEVVWTKIKRENLDLDYSVAIPKKDADKILILLENDVTYYSGDLARVKLFGKIHPLPRLQSAYGDPGVSYTFSGVTVPAQPRIPVIENLRDLLYKLKGIHYNFVLVNKYRNGLDHIGEHRDNEPDLDDTSPIASMSFGQKRQFVLKHKDARKKGDGKRLIPKVQIDLDHGSILFMNPPTNKVWYHSLPARKGVVGTRVNLTFRKILNK